MNTASVTCERLAKSFGNVRALNEVSFEVNRGEIFGFIGPDGAGKTTLFRILTTLLIPDSGTAMLEGLDCVKDYKKIRQVVGYAPGRFSLYADLTVEENLNFYASIFNTTVSKNYHLIRDIYVQLEPFKKRLAGRLSGGMKQKLSLCCAIIHKPTLLILDEPTTGVDAISRKEFWELLAKYRDTGMTIIVSTPYMDEASLCDRVALIQNGNILDINKPAAIVNTHAKRIYAISAEDSYRLLMLMKSFPGENRVYAFGDAVHFTPGDPGIEAKGIENFLAGKVSGKAVVQPMDPGIEDCFMDLMLKE